MNHFLTYTLFLLLTQSAMHVTAQVYTDAQRKAWLLKAEASTPSLVKTKKEPLQLVNIIEDSTAFQACRAVHNASISRLYDIALKNQPSVIVDFGEHVTGYVSFSLQTLSQTADAPTRLRFTFGEVPSELIIPFDPYPGSLSRAWLQDEVVTVMTMQDTVTISRRLAFRYVKIELMAQPSYEFSFSTLYCEAVTSAASTPAKLAPTTPDLIRAIDSIGLITLKECMQTVYEDGPKRDQRLWIGDLYLEALANMYSYRQHDLTKRCLYLLAALSGDNGFLHATVYERPEPAPQLGQFLLEYALLFNVALKDYLEATGDYDTANDLWPVAKKQLDIVHQHLNSYGLIDFEKAGKSWWIFFDWKDELHKEAALQGFVIFALKRTYELASILGRQDELSSIPPIIDKMTVAARRHMYDKKTGVFVGTLNAQHSYASQIWMVLAGVPGEKEARRALTALESLPDVCKPGTPYLYHYYISALIESGLTGRAKEALVSYWGGMIKKGADTFWEAYDPENDFISPYNFFPMNSYCHAWSCTPVYFIRKYPEIFQQ